MPTSQVVRLLHKAVKIASVSPDSLSTGDFIIVTGAENDIVGIVDNLQKVANQVELILHTAEGLRTTKISDKNYIHLIKRADMLNLRDHTDYERELKDMEKEKHGYESGLAERPEYGPVEDSEKSALPTSKVSLNLQKKAEVDIEDFEDKINAVHAYLEDTRNSMKQGDSQKAIESLYGLIAHAEFAIKALGGIPYASL